MSKSNSQKNTVVVYSIRVIELVMQIMVFSLAYMFIVIGFLGRVDFSPFLCLLIVFFPVVLLYIVRGWCNNRAVTIAAHVAAAFPVIILTMDKIAGVSYIVIYGAVVIYSISLILNKKSHTDEHMPIGMALFFIVAMIVGNITKRDIIEKWSLYYGIVFIILQVLYHNLNNMNDIMIMNSHVKNFPAGQMMRVNTFIIGIVAVICIGAMFIINNPYVYRLLAAVKDIIINGLRFLFSFIGKGEADEPQIEETTASAASDGDMMLPVEMESGIIQDILNGIAMIIGIIVIIALIVCIAAAFLRLMKKMRGRDGVQGDIREFVSPDESKIKLERKKKKADYVEDDAAAAKVRRLYKNMVAHDAKRKKISVASNMTPDEISGKHISVSADEATMIYEKARYSDEDISTAELDKMREIKKKQRQQT